MTIVLVGCQTNAMKNYKFESTILAISNSDIYENPDNWNSRALNPSDDEIIVILRTSTNDFLKRLEVVYNSDSNRSDKLMQIETLVDELPWDALDTEEKMFLADTLAPAIEQAGFDPWDIF